MSTFSFLILCIQACMVQIVFSLRCDSPPVVSPPCGCGSTGVIGYGGLGAGSIIAPGSSSYMVPSAPAALSSSPSYSGSGFGYLSVLGDVPVSGSSYIQGSVPIVGAADFYGSVPAVGTVLLSGTCGCGCY